MPTPSDAFDAASGRTPNADGSDAAALARARRILALRRRALDEEGCPPAARARAAGLFSLARPVGWAERARLLFDSWRDGAPATRGTGNTRLLRLVQGDVSVDIGIEPDVDASLALQVAVEGAPPTAELFVFVDEVEAPIPVELDGDGTGFAWAPAHSRTIEVEVFDGPHALLFSDPLALEPGS